MPEFNARPVSDAARAAMLAQLPPGIRSRQVDNGNGLNVHILEAGFEQPGRECVLLLHGFPELAFSWRKVMLPLAEAGYHVVAPDQRGYGMTEGGGACALAAHTYPDKLHTVGLPMEGHDMRVISEDGEELPRGEIGEVVEPELVVGASPEGQRQIGAIAEGVAQPPEPQSAFVIGAIGHQHREQTVSVSDEIRPFEMALRLAGPALAE